VFSSTISTAEIPPIVEELGTIMNVSSGQLAFAQIKNNSILALKVLDIPGRISSQSAVKTLIDAFSQNNTSTNRTLLGRPVIIKSSTPIMSQYSVSVGNIVEYGEVFYPNKLNNLNQNQKSIPQEINRNALVFIIVPSVLGMTAMIAVAIIAIYILRKFKRNRENTIIILREDTECQNIGSLTHTIRTSPHPIGEPPKPPNTPEELRVQYPKPNFSWEVDYESLIFESQIGTGTFGEVWKGQWRCSNVAIKKLKDRNFTESQLNEFKLEIAIMISIRPHANIIQLLGASTTPTLPVCFVMELLDGGSLESFLKYQLPSPQQSLSFCKGIAAGLFHLHIEGHVHGYLAAKNILLTSKFEVKIAGIEFQSCFVTFFQDFGVAKILSHELPNQQIGLVKWMAPESLSNRTFSVQSDVWAFGMIIYEILTQEQPFSDLTPMEACSRIVFLGIKPHIDKKNINHSILHKLKTLQLHCHQYTPEKRPTIQQLTELLDDIETSTDENEAGDFQSFDDKWLSYVSLPSLEDFRQ
jgi:hypothetical protein